MKKVFSVKKFEEVMKKKMGEREVKRAKEFWANACDGLTAREMKIKHGCLTVDKWMIEVDE